MLRPAKMGPVPSSVPLHSPKPALRDWQKVHRLCPHSFVDVTLTTQQRLPSLHIYPEAGTVPSPPHKCNPTTAYEGPTLFIILCKTIESALLMLKKKNIQISQLGRYTTEISTPFTQVNPEIIDVLGSDEFRMEWGG